MSKEVTLHVAGSFEAIERRISSSVLQFERGESVEETHLTIASSVSNDECRSRFMSTRRLSLSTASSLATGI